MNELEKPVIRVSAAIFYQAGQVMLFRRGPGGRGAGKWEFPGGKQEAGESAEGCILRELREELQADAKVDKLFATITEDEGDRVLLFSFFLVHLLSGGVTLCEHAESRRGTPAQLSCLELCPADRQILERLGEKHV